MVFRLTILRCSKALRLIAFLCTCLFFNGAAAELFKYQDAKGKWHFTDRVPKDHHDNAQSLTPADQNKQQPDAKTDAKTDAKSSLVETDSNNLDIQLNRKFKPTTPVEIASLAVVGIESKLGNGSGFFISRDGHIVTNQHVIRPNKNTEQQLEILEKRQSELTIWERNLQQKKKRLNELSGELSNYKQHVASLRGNKAAVATADYNYRKSEFESYKKNYDEEERAYKTQSKPIIAAHRELIWAIRLAQMAKTFNVKTKDQQTYTAQLVYISKDYDLALLKIDNYITPISKFGNSQALKQGERVFAIGSPLGQSDSVTSGVITRIQPHLVITDTQILPGNSGGPLINEAGDIVAVNTWRYAAPNSLGGFGHSIPVELMLQEFGDRLK